MALKKNAENLSIEHDIFHAISYLGQIPILISSEILLFLSLCFACYSSLAVFSDKDTKMKKFRMLQKLTRVEWIYSNNSLILLLVWFLFFIIMIYLDSVDLF